MLLAVDADGWVVVVLAVEPRDVKRKEKNVLLTRMGGGRRGRTNGVRVKAPCADPLRVVEDAVCWWPLTRMDGWCWCWPSSLGT